MGSSEWKPLNLPTIHVNATELANGSHRPERRLRRLERKWRGPSKPRRLPDSTSRSSLRHRRRFPLAMRLRTRQAASGTPTACRGQGRSRPSPPPPRRRTRSRDPTPARAGKARPAA